MSIHRSFPRPFLFLIFGLALFVAGAIWLAPAPADAGGCSSCTGALKTVTGSGQSFSQPAAVDAARAAATQAAIANCSSGQFPCQLTEISMQCGFWLRWYCTATVQHRCMSCSLPPRPTVP